MQALWRGADNDKNALLVARYLSVSDIVLITNTNGVYLNKDDTSTRIKELSSDTITESWMDAICWEKSQTWTGGMRSKLAIGREFAKTGGVTHICDGVTSTVYQHIMGRTIRGGTRISA
jgi:glutamate 5-kinase